MQDLRVLHGRLGDCFQRKVECVVNLKVEDTGLPEIRPVERIRGDGEHLRMEQLDPFQQAYNAPCPACAHRLLLHRMGPCGELIGRPLVRMDGADFQVALPGCGCPALSNARRTVS